MAIETLTGPGPEYFAGLYHLAAERNPHDAAKAEPLRAIVRRLAERRSAIEADADLTDTGRNKARAKLWRENRAGIAAWHEQVVAPVETAQRDLTRQLSRAGAPEVVLDDTTDFYGMRRLARQLREQEIRQRLGDLDPLAAAAIYHDAPAEVRAALESAPPVLIRREGRPAEVLPQLDPALVADAARARAEASDPETAAILRTVVERLAALEGLERAALHALGADPQPLDHLAAIARGEHWTAEAAAALKPAGSVE